MSQQHQHFNLPSELPPIMDGPDDEYLLDPELQQVVQQLDDACGQS